MQESCATGHSTCPHAAALCETNKVGTGQYNFTPIQIHVASDDDDESGCWCLLSGFRNTMTQKIVPS